MLQGWIDHLLAARESPTADLYFANAACSGWRGAIRLAPNVFKGPKSALVMRHSGGIAKFPDGPIVYLIDDDVPAGLDETTLPRRYRKKLAMLEWPAWRTLIRKADLIVAASDVLADRIGTLTGRHARVLGPHWSEPFASLDHHGEGPVDIAFLGSMVHRADLAFLFPAIERVLAVERRAHLHIPERHLLPASLVRHPRVHRLMGRDWASYRASARGRRFHIALYPLLDHGFNRARSPNKLIEHGICGAAGVYSTTWPQAQRVRCGTDGVVLPNDPSEWADATIALVRENRARLAMAAAGQALARRLNDPAPQRALWQSVLGVA